jgi:hypothetical protein
VSYFSKKFLTLHVSASEEDTNLLLSLVIFEKNYETIVLHAALQLKNCMH